MNKHLISAALKDIDGQFIDEARAESVKPAKRFQIKYIVSAAACACACAVILGVCLPIALSPSGSPAVPPQSDTGTPPNDVTPPQVDNQSPSDSNITPPQDGETSSGDSTPPDTDTDVPPVDTQKPYIEKGYVINGNSEPASPFMIAYKINREFDEQAENLSVQLSFGALMLDNMADLGITKVIVSVWNNDIKQTYVLKELTAEEFFVPEYDVDIKYTYGENEDGELVTVSETRTYKNEQTFIFPAAMCNKNKGTFVFNIVAYNGDDYVIGGGDQVYYLKINEKINFLTYREYQELNQ